VLWQFDCGCLVDVKIHLPVGRHWLLPDANDDFSCKKPKNKQKFVLIREKKYVKLTKLANNLGLSKNLNSKIHAKNKDFNLCE
jgi:hypothetical protein